MDNSSHRDASKVPESSYSAISGNEIALRVALCDLVQRLKRSEFMCKYLEQCRNELANEVIRLRAHNDQMIKDFASQSAHSDPNASSPHHLLLPGYGSPIQDAKSNAMLKIGSSTIKLDSFTDESWEEISNRLINELKQEMMNAELSDDEEFDSATEQPNSDPAFYETTNERYSTKDADQSTTDTKTQLMPNGQTQPADEYEVQEQHMAINDPPTKNFASYLLKNTAGDHTNRSTPSTTDNQTLTKNDFKALGLSNGNEMLKVIEIYDSTGQQRKFDLNVLLQSYAIRPPQDSKSNTTDAGSPYDLIEKVLHNYNVDLEDITKQVLLHNERLLKLKGKHLRNYFRRQLDHTNSSDTTTTS